MISYKSQVGDSLYCINFLDGTSIPFRLLTNKEFNSCRTSFALGSIPEDDIYEFIYQNCILDQSYKDTRDKLRAGVPVTVAKVIFHMSGPTSIEFVTDLLNVERKAAQTLESQMKSAICKTFPGYTMDKLDALDFPTLVSLFAQAESILLQMNLIEKPFDIFEPNPSKERDMLSTLEEDAKLTAQAMR